MISRRSFLKSGLLFVPAVGLGASPVIVRRSNVSKTPYSDVISYWKMEEATGVRLDSVSANHFTPGGTVPAGNAAGVNGNCLSSLKNGHLQSNFTIFNDLASNKLPFSFSSWTKVVNFSAWTNSTIVGSVNIAVCDGYLLQVDATLIVKGMFITSAGVAETASTACSIPTAWNHVVMTFDNPVLSVYANGLKGTNVISAAYGAATGGCWTNTGQGSVSNPTSDMMVDELCFWKRALIDAEVAWLYNSGAGRFL